MIVKRRYPNYFTGFEETEYQIETVEQLMDLDFVKGCAESPGFTKFSIAKSSTNTTYSHLMAEFNKDDKHTWWAIAYFPQGYGDLELDEFVPTYKEVTNKVIESCIPPYKPREYNTLDKFLKHVVARD